MPLVLQRPTRTTQSLRWLIAEMLEDAQTGRNTFIFMLEKDPIWLPYACHPNINPECFSTLVNETRTTINNRLHDQHVERKQSLKRRRSFRANIVCIAKENSIEETVIDENYHDYLEIEDAMWLNEVQSMLEGLDTVEAHWSLPSPIKRRKGVRRRKVRPSLASLQSQLDQSQKRKNSSNWGKIKNVFLNKSRNIEEFSIEDLIVLSQSKLQIRRPMLQQIALTNTLRMIEPTKFKPLFIKDKRKKRDTAGPRFGPRALTRRNSFDSMAVGSNENFTSPSGFTFCIKDKHTKAQLSDNSFPIEEGFRHHNQVKDKTTAQMHTVGLHLQSMFQIFKKSFDDNKVQYTFIDDDEIADYEYVHCSDAEKRRSSMVETDSGVDLDLEDELPLHLLMSKRRLSISSAP